MSLTRNAARSWAAAMAVLSLVGLAGCSHNDATQPREPGKSPDPAAVQMQTGPLEAVYEFNGPMPTGVTVSQDGRVFVNYPRWEDPIQFTVAEIRNGQEVPYP